MTVTANEADAKRFLTALFETKQSSDYILIWNGINKRSSWFQTAQDAAMFAAKQAATTGHNIYVGTALSKENLGAKRRGVEAEVAAIAAFWIDIDFQDEVHKKKNLPKDLDASVELVRRFPISPTFIIISGHGIQAWWIFDSVWNFADDSERTKAKELSTRFQRFFKAEAARNGLDVDSTFDLSRIYRVPGTVNYKRQPYKPVTIFEENAKIPRSELVAEIEKLPQLESEQTKLVAVQQAQIATIDKINVNGNGHSKNGHYYTREGWLVDFVVAADRDIGANKLEALKGLDPKIKRTYEHKRKEEADQSMSAYDMRLISFAVQYNWTNQELADLIITHRNHYKENLRLNEVENYYARSIHKARTNHSKKEEVTNAIYSESGSDRQANLDEINTALELRNKERIKEIERRFPEPFSFVVRREDGVEIKLGDSDGLTNQRNFRKHFTNATKHFWQEHKKVHWENIVKKMLLICEDVESPEEATYKGITKLWLEDYLRIRLCLDQSGTVWDRLSDNKPVLANGKPHISLTGLRLYIEQKFGERPTREQLSDWLRQIGCYQEKVNLTEKMTGDKATSRRLWVVSDVPDDVQQRILELLKNSDFIDSDV